MLQIAICDDVVEQTLVLQNYVREYRQLRNKFAILIENKDRLLHCKILRMEGGGH